MRFYQGDETNVSIKAEDIQIGHNVSFGRDIDIIVKGAFTIGDRSRLGDDVHIRGRNVEFGADLYHSQGLRVGGGGCDRPRANLRIGDRCTIHNNYINLADEVTLGDDVGLSPDVFILTHGFWLSVLKGFPAKFAPVVIENGVIVGQRSMIMMDVNVGENAVVGAHSVVTKDIPRNCIAAGNPAKIIRFIEESSQIVKDYTLIHIVSEYQQVAEYHGVKPEIITNYPYVYVDGCRFNVETFKVTGEETEITDSWRDHARRYGLRFYTERPFKSLLRWE